MGKQIAIWGGVFGATFLALFFLIRSSGPVEQVDVVVPEIAQLAADDHVRGNPASPAILVEYGDFQCPGCAAYEPLLQQLSGEFGDKLAIVFRHFPLPSHKYAVLSAKYSEAASLQGKFWEMHDKIYEGQATWSSSGDAEEIFDGYARELGLDMTKLAQDVESDAVADRVERDRVAALGFKINSTPTFYLNGKKIQPGSYEQFRTFIQQAVPGVTP